MKKIVFLKKMMKKTCYPRIKKQKKDNLLSKKKTQGFIKKRVCSLELYN